MISPPGVLIPAEWAAEVGQYLGRSLRIDFQSSPKLLEIYDELVAVGEAVSDASASGSRRLPDLPDLPHNPGVTVSTFAKVAGLTPRRVRQMCAAGDVDAYKVRGSWIIAEGKERECLTG